ncbi:MAG: RDD family protein, partial [Candidatus Eremiobacteraeota bacterium]|nr:RDD family protein [Candidatus Eremiobacteraeota bacterium]
IAIDLAIQIGLTVALFWTAIGLSANAVAFDVPRWSRSAAIAAVAFVLFAIYFGYFILFEAFWNGQTPGKRLLGIRVVRDRGMPLDLTSSFVRNVVRTVEFSLGFYAIAAVSTLLSSENKRLGDYAAGTIVVRDARSEAPRYAAERAEDAWIDSESRALIERFLARRDALSSDRRATIAAELASRVRPHVASDVAALDDEALLERVT